LEAQQDEEPTVVFAWAFNPHNFAGTGEPLPDQPLYPELPLLDKNVQELIQALHCLRAVSGNAKNLWLRVTAKTAYRCIDKILRMYEVAVC
jgi:hypothetical protein